MIDAQITEFIATVGFPIVAFIMMYNLNKTVITKNTEAINGLKELILGFKK